jgi:hypothetical protein
LKKKLTDVKAVKTQINGKEIEGVLVSDKVGEVKFMPLGRFVSEGIKQ